MNDDVGRREATIRDVAKLAKVSPATAGRALGGYGFVSPASRDRVLTAASALGYRRNSLASSMISGSTQTLGVLVPDIENPHFATAVRGIADEAKLGGFGVLLINTDEDVELEREAALLLLEKRVDGLIIGPARTDEHASRLSELLGTGVPAVLLDRVIPGLSFDAVVIDNADAARSAVEHLVELGHRRIAVIAAAAYQRYDLEAGHPPGGSGAPGGRVAGYLAALRAAGISIDPALVCLAPSDLTGATHATIAELRSQSPTAVFATDSTMTLASVAAVRALGLSVPRDISLVGFDDTAWTSVMEPPITVVRQPVYELGQMAARLLLQRIDGDVSPFRTVSLTTELVLRQSTMSCPA